MLTTEQLATLKTHIQATSDLNALYVEGDAGALANLLNAEANPAFVVWKSKVFEHEILQNGFDWTRLDNLSVGKARVWERIFSGDGRSLNPSKTNVQSGINAVWVGTQADLDVRAAVYVHCKRNASRLEQLFATGTGTTAVPATLVVEGPLNYVELIGL